MLLIGSKNKETPAEKRASRDPAVWPPENLRKKFVRASELE